MKTLLFSPMYLEGERLERNIKYIKYYVPDFKEKLGFEHVYFADNASKQKDIDDLLLNVNKNIKIHQFEEHLPRLTHYAYEYWYRAFANGIQYAKNNGFEKIIHIDSDVYLLNNRICNYIKNIDTGWSTLWCNKYSFPASEIQIICKDQFDVAYKFMTEDYLKYYPNDAAENRIPWTHIERGFSGDRYGETREKQLDSMEWYGQTPNDIVLTFNDKI